MTTKRRRESIDVLPEHIIERILDNIPLRNVRRSFGPAHPRIGTRYIRQRSTKAIQRAVQTKKRRLNLLIKHNTHTSNVLPEDLISKLQSDLTYRDRLQFYKQVVSIAKRVVQYKYETPVLAVERVSLGPPIYPANLSGHILFGSVYITFLRSKDPAFDKKLTVVGVFKYNPFASGELEFIFKPRRPGPYKLEYSTRRLSGKLVANPLWNRWRLGAPGDQNRGVLLLTSTGRLIKRTKQT